MTPCIVLCVKCNLYDFIQKIQNEGYSYEKNQMDIHPKSIMLSYVRKVKAKFWHMYKLED